MFKKLACTALAAALMLSVAGCGASTSSSASTAAPSTASTGGASAAPEASSAAASGGAGGLVDFTSSAADAVVNVNQKYESSKDTSGYSYAVVVKDAASGWFVRMEAGLKQFSEDYGVEVFMDSPATADSAQQIECLTNAINSGIDALCVVPIDPAACDTVLKEAQDMGIAVVTHEGSSSKNTDINIEAFSNAGYGAYIMDNLAEAMGGEGVYTTMVAYLTNASQNEWADGAVARAEEAYPDITILEAQPRLESENNSETAYQRAKELLRAYPEVTGFVGCCSLDTPGIARAIDELGLTGKVFVCGTGMPNECRELIKNDSIYSAQLWDPAAAGYAMCVIATMLLDDQTITEGTNLGIESYDNLTAFEGSDRVFQGAGWISLTKDNVDEYDF